MSDLTREQRITLSREVAWERRQGLGPEHAASRLAEVLGRNPNLRAVPAGWQDQIIRTVLGEAVEVAEILADLFRAQDQAVHLSSLPRGVTAPSVSGAPRGWQVPEQGD